jgi:hypothetical protein
MGMRSRRAVGGAAFALAALGAVAAHAAGPAMVVEADMVRGVQKDMTAAPCVLTSQFKHKEEVVWRIRVIDARTGKPLDDKGLKSVMVTLSSGQSVAARFGGHPPPKPMDTFWSVAWVVPDDYPTGSFTYHVTATDKHGHTATFEPFKTPPSLPTIVADSGMK